MRGLTLLCLLLLASRAFLPAGYMLDTSRAGALPTLVFCTGFGPANTLAALDRTLTPGSASSTHATAGVGLSDARPLGHAAMAQHAGSHEPVQALASPHASMAAEDAMPALPAMSHAASTGTMAHDMVHDMPAGQGHSQSAHQDEPCAFSLMLGAALASLVLTLFFWPLSTRARIVWPRIDAARPRRLQGAPPGARAPPACFA